MADEEDYSSLPLTERAVHKVWKVRLAAYEETKKQFASSGSESDACFRPFLDNPAVYKKIVTDSNVVAQEAGISSLASFLEFGGSNACLRTRATTVAPLVEKGLSSSRAGTRQSATDVLLWYIELDTPDPVIEELTPFLTHRMPKLVAAVVAALTAIFKNFGAKTVSPKPLMKDIPKLFAHADKNVRAEATNLVVELYKWLGKGVSALILPELKPVQQKELEELFSKFDASGETVQQIRFIKSQKEAMERQQANGISNSAGNGATDGLDSMEDDSVDPLDLVDAVSILPKVSPNLAEQMGSTKWKDRKEALEELLPVLQSSPKIENDDFTDMVRLLAKCIQKDANIQVVALAANCVETLAKGLRQNFARYESTVLGPLLERTKEKKVSVAEALGAALDAVYKSTSLSSVLDTTLEHLKHKTPQIKIESAKFLVRCLKTTPVSPNTSEVKSMVESSIKLLSDTQEPVRTGGAEVLGVLMKITGERAMNASLDGVDDIKKAKIKEFFESAVVIAKPAQAAPAPAPAPARAAPGQAANRHPGHPGHPGANNPAKPAARSIQGMRSTPAKPPPAARRRLVSPVKAPELTSQPAASSLSSANSAPFDDQPSIPPPSSVPRPGGLTNRVLQSRQPASRPLASSASNASAIPDARLVELDQLRSERAEWIREREQMKWKAQEDQAEKNRLMQELSEAQRKVAEHIEKQTNETLKTKSLETQLTRLHSDLETYRVRNNKLEAELERVKSLLMRQQQHMAQPSPQYANTDQTAAPTPGSSSMLRSLSTGKSAGASTHRRGTSSSPKSPAMTLQFGLDTRSSSTSSTNSTSSIRTHNAANSALRRSVDFSNLGLSSMPDDEYYKTLSSSFQRQLNTGPDKENSLSMSGYRPLHRPPPAATAMSEDSEMTEAPPSPSRIPVSSASAAATSTTTGPENWRRAAEVTSELRARIEAMRRARAVV
ncbi:Stu2p [Sugiyamaella lignohabitans]|uniref:Stu2p n=1 Tax=Sugiyamaella lignohabitans TaxID=796027 RepID=A0A161HHM7_9ASCO|nr:Stu2p [Sugiyamaella lignohabitans]ANB11697.1 Stu2p [Sugiyamaella lignohabitans]